MYYMTLVNKADSTRKAHCSIIIEDAIALNDIWVVEGKNGLFVSFPQRPYEDRESGETKYASIYAPITKEARQALTDAVLEEYSKMTA